ncbi:MAG: FtsQ-type POTRA domain-containing protein [Gammaproteobacteria bacterium]|nr:FtsQ-type POTRA domain-containing protein [Gammaproteobacteria bacterium]
MLFICWGLFISSILFAVYKFPFFSIKKIVFDGHFIQTDRAELSKMITPYSAKNILNFDIKKLYHDVQPYPWIDHIVVYRKFPDTIVVQFNEHELLGVFESPKSEKKLLSKNAKLFKFPENYAIPDGLPIFIAEPTEVKKLMRVYTELSHLEELTNNDLRITSLELNPQNYWILKLNNTIKLQLNKGDINIAYMQKVLAVLKNMADQNFKKMTDIEYIDFGYQSGVAIKYRS